MGYSSQLRLNAHEHLRFHFKKFDKFLTLLYFNNMGVINIVNMCKITTNNRWVREKTYQKTKSSGRNFWNKTYNDLRPRKKSKNKDWVSFKKTKRKMTYMSSDDLIITIKNKTYIYPPKAGVIIFNTAKTRVLVIKNAYNPALSKWGLPKGHLEDGETRLNCAQRELLEETGIKINIEECDPNIKINNTIYYIYSVNEDNYNPSPIDTNEINAAEFKDILVVKNLKINRELNVVVTNKLKLAKKLARTIV